MSVRIYGSPFLHRHGHFDEADPRLRWSVCGIRSVAFAWHDAPRGRLPRCPGCWR